MFIITKSANSNCVVYSANLLPSNALDPSEPCRPSWVMFNNPKLPSGKHPTEELNVIERNTAYGVTCSPDPRGRPGHYECAVASLTDRVFDVHVDEATGRPVAATTVNGVPNSTIRTVHVVMADSWIPRVDYIDITGVGEGGELIKERKQA
jgi:hypothetical protein